ncbi:MAG: phage portal protein [Epsilonproteobacteria bacterium]|nr:phage portal protein [Campylobacterota bacterium]
MLNLSKIFNFGESAKYGVGFSPFNLFGTSKAGVKVNYNTASAHTTVMSCFKILSEAVASMPINLMVEEEKKGVLSRTVNRKHKLYEVLMLKPNPFMTRFSWIQAVMMNLVSRGNAFCQILYNQHGELVGFVPLVTDQMQVFTDGKGEVVYRYSHFVHGVVDLDEREVLHIVGLSLDGLWGLSPIAYSQNSIGLSMAMEEYGSNFFKNGSNAGGVFEMPTKLSMEAFNRLRDSLKEKYQGLTNSGKPMLLEEGLSFKPISINNNDSQFLESRKFQKSEIASIFRIPPHLINELDNATFTNIEQQSLEFATYTLTPWIERIEQALNIVIAREIGKQYKAEFNMDFLIRGDIQSRFNANGVAIRDGWMTRNEVRIKEGLNPLVGLDEPILPLNMGTQNEDTK